MPDKPRRPTTAAPVQRNPSPARMLLIADAATELADATAYAIKQYSENSPSDLVREDDELAPLGTGPCHLAFARKNMLSWAWRLGDALRLFRHYRVTDGLRDFPFAGWSANTQHALAQLYQVFHDAWVYFINDCNPDYDHPLPEHPLSRLLESTLWREDLERRPAPASPDDHRLFSDRLTRREDIGCFTGDVADLICRGFERAELVESLRSSARDLWPMIRFDLRPRWFPDESRIRRRTSVYKSQTANPEEPNNSATTLAKSAVGLSAPHAHGANEAGLRWIACCNSLCNIFGCLLSDLAALDVDNLQMPSSPIVLCYKENANLETLIEALPKPPVFGDGAIAWNNVGEQIVALLTSTHIGQGAHLEMTFNTDEDPIEVMVRLTLTVATDVRSGSATDAPNARPDDIDTAGGSWSGNAPKALNDLTPGARALAAAYELQKEGKPISLRRACERAGVDRVHLRKKYPDAAEAIQRMAMPDRTLRRSARDKRTGNIDAVDDSHD